MQRIGEIEPRTAEFFDALFEPGDIVEIRRFPSKRQEWWLASELPMLAAGPNEDVYFGANPRKSRGGSEASDVLHARCVFVDFDHVSDPGAAEELIRNAELPSPTCVLTSGRGVHAYWRLEEPITDLVDWRSIQLGLIAALATDGKIHDPPRIMRVPGSTNMKNGKKSAVFRVRDVRYPEIEFPRRQPRAVVESAPSAIKDPSRLARRTLVFLHSGAAEGHRNGELFAAACDMSGCGYSVSEIENELVPVAVRCGLDQQEATAAVRSACSKARGPSKPEPISPEDVWGSSPKTFPVPVTGTDNGASTHQTREEQPRSLAPLSNVFESFEEVQTRGKDGTAGVKVNRRLVYKSAPLLAAELVSATNGWPKMVGDKPFLMVGKGLDQRPHLLRGASDLFGWVHSQCSVFWTEKACFCRETKGERTPLNKSEFYEYVRMTSEVERYASVSVYPHHPPLPGLYYPKIDLPEPTGEALEEFVSKLNPETDDDRRLLTALILTPGAGLAPGTRPLFVLTSDAGQGAGKTATARAISDIWGGSCDLDYTEDWASLAKRIMSSDDAFARVMLFDNVKGSVFGTGTLEAAITAKTITGWKSYVGQVSRPNDATFVVTFNDPALTRDLTERAVVIKIGRQRHQFDFVTWAIEFVKRNRAQLLSDALGMLRSGPLWSVGAEADRFQAWQSAVLTRIPGGGHLGSLIVGRRQDVDADYDAAACLYIALADHCRGSGTDEITAVQLRELMEKAGLWSNDARQSAIYNKAAACKLAKRMLSGRRVLEVARNADGTPKYRHCLDGDTRTRAAVYKVSMANTSHQETNESDEELPI